MRIEVRNRELKNQLVRKGWKVIGETGEGVERPRVWTMWNKWNDIAAPEPTEREIKGCFKVGWQMKKFGGKHLEKMTWERGIEI